MNTEYADAVAALEDAIASAVYRVEERLTKAEIAAELRRAADELDPK